MNAKLLEPGPSDTRFYEAAQKIYPREIEGRYARRRRLTVFVLLGLFYGMAWLSYQGQQLLLFDLPGRKFHIFGLTLWPQDFFYMALLMIIAAYSLFLVTAFAGRIFCGYACPQTVWTEFFLWVERLTEGPRAKRMKLDQGKWNLTKLARKSAKQALWIAFAAYTGFTFVGYFMPIRTLAPNLLHGTLGGWGLVWIALYSLATYGNAGFLREQVCKYMCPYARFQSVMFDKNTLIISYDQARGEPRGAGKRGTARTAGLGDCLDCTLCVQVCPTGIDIRNGLQYECIACAACIDACDPVMTKVGQATGLIRYTTEQAPVGQKSQLLRPRLIVYSALLLLASGAIVVSLLTRTPVVVDVIRDRNALFREVHGDWIENAYTVKLVNEDGVAHRFTLHVSGLRGVQLAAPTAPVLVDAGSVAAISVRIESPSDVAHGVHRISLQVAALDAPAIRRVENTRFIGPNS